MRVFVALDVAKEVRNRISEYVLVMRQHAPDARWVQGEGVHVTLKFIGEASPRLVEAIRGALGSIRIGATVEMEFRGVGFFPDRQKPRVFWVGIRASPMLADLALGIERNLEPLGIKREVRPFQPHLTLARFDRLRGIGSLRTAVERMGAGEFGSAVAHEYHLYESRLGPSGAHYTRLHTFDFARGAQ